MKSLKSIIFIGLVLSFGLFTSCNKDDDENIETNDPTGEVTGTYTGSLTTDNNKSSRDASVVVTLETEYSLRIHCFANDFDTTLIYNMFQNGDSVMICYSGQNFNNEYGHHMSTNWNNCSENWNGTNYQMCTWDKHMMDDHNTGDVHYGGFNMNNHTFNYRFKVTNNSSTYFEEFSGTKTTK